MLKLSAAAAVWPALSQSAIRTRSRQATRVGALQARLTEALYAFTVADAMGGSIENWLPAEIQAAFGNWDFTRFLPPTSERDRASGHGKGDGRTTDDTINLEILIDAYLQHGTHLDSYRYAASLVREHTRARFIAERGEAMPPLDRPLWWPERYVYQRLAINNVEPRYAGIGNYINEGFQGIVLPIGAVNAGDPWRAYTECVGLGLVHTESFGIEAAACNAAAYAAAFRLDSTIEHVIATVTSLAQDGSARALAAVLAVTDPNDPLPVFVARTRAAVVPYLQLAPTESRDPQAATPKLAHDGSNIARASRLGVVENFPIALACLRYGGGDYQRTLKASLFYGRDAETIAAVSTSLLAAIRGAGTVPKTLTREVDRVNRRNYAELATKLHAVIASVHAADRDALAARDALLR